MSETTTVRSGGIGFMSLLTILFIGLKLGGIINWSWWLVLLPLYGGIALFLALLIFGFIAVGIISVAVQLFSGDN